MYEQQNLHVTDHSSFHQRFRANICARIIDDYIIRPCIIENHLSGVHYTDFVEDTLPVLLEDVPLHVRESTWFLHDGIPPHFAH
jgi:hypothetical protein